VTGPAANQPTIYEVRVRGHLDPRRARWFAGMTLTPLPPGDTLIRGPAVDLAALHGLLNRIRDIEIGRG
jgi:hypothetical protein